MFVRKTRQNTEKASEFKKDTVGFQTIRDIVSDTDALNLLLNLSFL